MTDRILVIRGGALGDFVLGLPALQALRAAFPHSHLELVAPATVLPLASRLADDLTPLERAEVASLFGDAGQLPEEIAGRYRDLDLAVLWLADRDGSVRASFQALNARLVLQAPAIPDEPGRHAADHLLQTLLPLGIVPSGPAIPMVQPGGLAREAAETLFRDMGLAASRFSPPASAAPVVAVHPGSGGVRKNWRPERFAAVVDRLERLGARPVVIQGPADEEPVRRVLAAVQGSRPTVVEGLGVEELAAFLSLCSAYLGNDSGVTHLAAALGIPTIALFGPTDPTVWGPRGPRTIALDGGRLALHRTGFGSPHSDNPMDAIDVEPVLEALKAIMHENR